MGYAHHVEAAYGKENGNEYGRKTEPAVYDGFRHAGSKYACAVFNLLRAAQYCTLVSSSGKEERNVCYHKEDSQDGEHGTAYEQECFVAECI